jgi:hypothetical protein
VNAEAEEATALEAVIRQQLGKKEQTVMNFRVSELAIALSLLIVTFPKSSINPITDPKSRLQSLKIVKIF